MFRRLPVFMLIFGLFLALASIAQADNPWGDTGKTVHLTYQLAQKRGALMSIPDDSGGSIVTWYDNPSGSVQTWFQRLDSNGNPVWPAPVKFGNTANTLLAIDMFRYQSSTIVRINNRFYRLSDTNGTDLWAATPILSEQQTNFTARGIRLSDSQLLMTWTGKNTYAGELRYAVINLAAPSIGTANKVTHPDSTLTASVNDYEQWSSFSYSAGGGGAAIHNEQEISLVRFTQAGASAGVTMVRSTTPGGYTRNLVTMSDGSDGAIIGWGDSRSGAQGVYLQRVNSDGLVQWTTDGAWLATNDYRSTVLLLPADATTFYAVVSDYAGNVKVYRRNISDGAATTGWSTPVTIPQAVKAFGGTSDGAGGVVVIASTATTGKLLVQGVNADRSLKYSDSPYRIAVDITSLSTQGVNPYVSASDSGLFMSYGMIPAPGTWSSNDTQIYVQKVTLSAPAPTNPTTVSETGGTTSNTWQQTVSSPAFTWSGATDGDGSGIKNYDVYWGDSITGTTVVATPTSAAYSPTGPLADGTYYLRLRTRNNNDAVSDWATAFTFKYDGTAPTLPVTATETAHGCTGWCNDLDVAFSWAAASDGSGSGQKEYDVYWGTDAGGSTPTLTQTGVIYDPTATDGSAHYLRLRARDNAGNESAWATLFSYQYDNTPPTNPDTAVEGGGIISGTWASTTPSFTLSGGSDAGAGISGYNYYFGPNPSGTPATFSAGAVITPTLAGNGTYYLRAEAVDAAGNPAGSVADLFTYQYDGTAPTAPAGAVEANGLTSGDWSNTTPSFTLSGGSDADSGLAGYTYYFGPNPSGTPATFSAGAVITPTLAGNGTYYLRAANRDEAGNDSSVADLFTFRYDTVAPSNPTTVTESHAISSNTWQNSVDTPTFTWSGAADGAGSGVEAYDIYWGTSAVGSTVTTQTTTSSYTPETVTAGTYYLRFRTYDQAGNNSVWQTGFVFKFDDLAPNSPTTATEAGGVISGTWQATVSSPSFSWSASVDAGGSGMAGYDVYWGDDPAGATAVTQVTSPAFAPGETITGTHYLRLRAYDQVGNTSAWATAFTFKYDLPPTAPTAVVEAGGAISNTWQATVSSPAFTWSGATANGGSAIAGYEVYWGTSSSGTTVVTTTTSAAYEPGVVADGTYYLRLRAKNDNGLTSAWTTGFIFKYDNDSPTAPATVTEDHGMTDDTWQNTLSNPAFTWSGATAGSSGIAGYDVYWGDSITGTSVTANISASSYSVGTLSGGVYYLRLRTQGNNGLDSDWATAFTFKFDNSVPTNPTTVSETGGAADNVWQSGVSTPAFTWSGASDTFSGVAGYEVYWGTSSIGTTVVTTTTTAAYTPTGTLTGGTPYYLRLRTYDNSGNISAWATAFTFKYEAAPTNPTTAVEDRGAVNDTWQSAVNNPVFIWSDTGAGSYDVYWGDDPAGTTVISNTGSTLYVPGTVTDGVYYLRLRARSTHNLPAPGWTTVFTFKYDLAPTAPTTITETGGATDGDWQNTIDTPSFTWSGATDGGGAAIAGYEVYWGDSAAGTTVVTTTVAAAYAPGTATEGTTYLRVRAKNANGLTSGWADFTFNYDAAAPTQPTTVSETGGAGDDAWQGAVSNPAFTWSGATDSGGSAIAAYDVYWGTEAAGTTVVTTTALTAYDPGAVTAGTPYYLRLRITDGAGNTSAWATAFTFKYDLAPTAPTSVTPPGGVADDTWQSSTDTPTLTWAGATDGGGSPIAEYDVYWGPSLTGTTVTTTTTGTSYTPETAATPGVPYYLRLLTRNENGQESAWATAFTFKYDLPPTNPTTVVETGGAISNTWQSVVSSPAFTWSGATTGGGSAITGYEVYWGTNASGTTVTTSTVAAAYEPGTTGNGIYYLRLRSKNGSGQTSAWTTGFVFKYDSSAPTNPTTVTETGGTADNTWQATVSTPAFTWSGAGDTGGSGVEAYEVYWGTSSSGTTIVTTTASAAYTPALAVSANSTTYLRLRTVDAAGNKSAWATAFTFKYDLPSTNPTAIIETGGAISGTWQSSVTAPAFTWSGATAGGGSAVASYDVYWGASSTGESVTANVTTAAYEPGTVGSGTRYLRLRAKNVNGLTAAWETAFVFKYDNTTPTAPTTVSETGGTVDGDWQNNVSAPAFTWSGATGGTAGIAGYDVYWGTSAFGTTVITTTTGAAYEPGATANGTRYLRIRTRGNNGLTSAWVTGFTFRYDSTAPTNPTTVSETGGATNDTWQSAVSSPAFTWSGAADTSGSGVDGYEVYWGTSSSGTTVATTTTTAAYAPGPVSAGSPYYLRLRTVDAAGNKSAWATAFTFKYDVAPTAPTTVSETGGATSDTWQSGVNSPAFTWSGASANGGSSIAGYEVYWGTNAAGTTVVTTTASAAYEPGAATAGSTYYLRLRTRNDNGLTSAWATGFVFKYDAAPTAPTTVIETGGVISNTWQASINSPDFTWSGATTGGGSAIAGYDVYWGTNASGTTVTAAPTSAAYSPPSTVTNGTYYLRIRTRNSSGQMSAWATGFIFKYDSAAPTAPTTVSETGGATSDTWQSTVSSPAFTWSGAADTGGSSIAGYEVYWGTSSSGTTVVTTTTGAAYEPGAVSAGSTYYLRLRTVDAAGNKSAWATAFTFKYDLAPTAPTTVTETGGVISNTWQSAVSSPDFTWSGATANGGSSISGYEVYWGTNAAGTTVIADVTTAAYSPGVVTNGTYYLRLRTKNANGLTSAWTTGFVFKYDVATPTPPTTVTETGGAADNAWQNSVSTPAFTWSGATGGNSGIAGYDVYWGTNASGTTVITTTSNAAYEPGATANGTYYLRFRTRSLSGQVSAWTTGFTFKYDSTAPSNPTIITEGHGVISGTWQATTASPTFNWIAGSDGAGSGVASYDVYWGTDANGTTVISNVAGQSYAPGAVSAGSPYYLRLRTRDATGNVAAWVTAFIFKYDLSPTNPTTVTETGGATNDTWQKTVYAPAFTWSGGSGAVSYDVYWGTSSTGNTAITTTTSAAYAPGPVGNGTYYLRLRARNGNDQTAAWATAFTFKFDNTPPAQVNRIDVDDGNGGIQDGVWQAVTGDAAFAWPVPVDAHSGVVKYQVYWGTSSTGVSASEQTAPTYDPAAIDSGTRFLRLKAYDRAGNSTQWHTLYEFKYDGSDPTVVLEAPEFYPATLSFDVRWAVTDPESGPANCTVTWAVDSRAGYLVNNQPYASVKSAQYFENLVSKVINLEATCANLAGSSTVVTATTTTVAPIEDTDSDELPGVWETANGLDPNNSADANGDLDSDELTNLQEYQHGTDPNKVDTDGDGLSDYDEVYALWAATAGEMAVMSEVGIVADSTTPIWWDSDGDGIGDGTEVTQGSDPLSADSPYNPAVDTDGDGLPDGWETAYGYDPSRNSDATTDTDGDGLTALQEYQHHASPLTADTDQDGLTDGAEVNIHGTDPNSWDTDRDRFPDAMEVAGATDPDDGNESPLVQDRDGDGMLDSWETANSVSDPTGDPDGDGLTNLVEFQKSTNPNAADTDGDGFNDNTELTAGTDPKDPASIPEGQPDTRPIYLPLILRH